jgi:hypothetical protein
MRWLAPRLADVPPTLRQRIEEAVNAAPDDGAAGPVLRSAAEALLARARTAPPGRETALTLLTADALITYACEAAADAAP